ncbi:MAG: ribosome silencing factor [Bacteroidales bacterium]|nr:ribosome silencing factor [Bacteroidales bacterium]
MKELDVIVEAMLEKKAQGVCSIDLTGTGTSITDYFVICNADSTTQVAAIADNIIDSLAKEGRKPARSQGLQNGFWAILDYGDIVVHVFQTEYREFYRLEELWSKAPRKDYKDE